VKITDNDFGKLQDEWYSRLEEDGFKDIERKPDKNIRFAGKNGGLLNEGNLDHLNRIDTIRCYFAIIHEYAFDETAVFKSEMHKYILQRYAEGARLCDIVRELTKLGMPRDRKAIKFIIRRYEMEWKIKNYTPKQLGKRTRATQS
jgi:hypothetical protein